MAAENKEKRHFSNHQITASPASRNEVAFVEPIWARCSEAPGSERIWASTLGRIPLLRGQTMILSPPRALNITTLCRRASLLWICSSGSSVRLLYITELSFHTSLGGKDPTGRERFISLIRWPSHRPPWRACFKLSPPELERIDPKGRVWAHSVAVNLPHVWGFYKSSFLFTGCESLPATQRVVCCGCRPTKPCSASASSILGYNERHLTKLQVKSEFNNELINFFKPITSS